ncbi:adenosylcobinamide-phosphate synthase CbiB [Chachezhania sediminis]|uniref:adenosylcobinamide-phosphate synthase CbiB n=1 Tax=Chachezhania sediminis TaxID=2599291 RepID=UPI00131B0270|nr:adenosylcobinamide-phosphate synthase CbiB [Chachezhania sediminis]
MTHALMLGLAMLVDAAMGEPPWLWSRLPHPAVLLGRAVAWLDRRLNNRTRGRGVVAGLCLVAGAGVLGTLLAQLGPVIEILAAAVLLAQKSLVDHVRAVATGLREGLPQGRHAVAMIVSRDTADMTEPAVARSAIESAAENMSDGVVAPAFWFLLGGLPGILIYKAVNTADSMIGYRTPRYENFGWAAARLDDLLNLVPARITALLIALTTGTIARWQEIAADARRHKSPNAGWPEAAMARALDIALAGPRSYDGQMRDLAWVNGPGRREIGPAQIDAAADLLWRVWAVATVATLALAGLGWLC